MKFSHKRQSNSAQSAIEFSIVAIVVCAGIFLMGPYIIRAINAHFKGWEDAVYDSLTDPLTQGNVITTLPTPGCRYDCGDETCCEDDGEDKNNCLIDCNQCPDGEQCDEPECVDRDTTGSCCEDGWDACGDGHCCADDGGYYLQSELTEDKTPKGGLYGDECIADCLKPTGGPKICDDGICERAKGEDWDNCCQDCAPKEYTKPDGKPCIDGQPCPGDGKCCKSNRAVANEDVYNEKAACCDEECNINGGGGHGCNETNDVCQTQCNVECCNGFVDDWQHPSNKAGWGECSKASQSQCFNKEGSYYACCIPLFSCGVVNNNKVPGTYMGCISRPSAGYSPGPVEMSVWQYQKNVAGDRRGDCFEYNYDPYHEPNLYINNRMDFICENYDYTNGGGRDIVICYCPSCNNGNENIACYTDITPGGGSCYANPEHTCCP